MKRLGPVLFAALMLALWWGLSLRLPEVLLPSPFEVAQAVWDDGAKLAEATWYTTVASVLGLGIASLVGLGSAAAFQRFDWLERAVYPYALLAQTVPIIAIAPLLQVWLGYGTPTAVATAAIVSFFPILSSANLGLRSTDRAQVELFQLYGASRWQILWKLRAPAALPYVFGGYRTAVGLSVIGAIVGEFIASNGFPTCLGYRVLFSARGADTASSFAAIGASTLLALALFLAVRGLERLVIGRWHPGV